VATISVASTSAAARRGSSFLASGTGPSNGSVGPEIEERVDVVAERVRLRGDVEDLVKEDVRLQRSHEEERGGARILHADDAGLGGAAEVIGDDGQAAARRGVFAADVEGQDDRGLRAAVHVDGEVLGDGARDERDELLGQAAEDDARVLGAAGGLQPDDARRQLDVARAHGRGEKGLLGRRVAQDRGRRDAELRGDVGEGGGLEALRGEDAPGGLEELFAGDGRWAAH
jgi:hypothetical protein